jgi:redox-sensitive bicupin YhaK (pirin superfamily)
MLRVLAIRAAQVTHPTGDPKFSVLQSIPGPFKDDVSGMSPFLMCDHFGPMVSSGEKAADDFDVPWHPHRGQDLLTYMVSGNGRHADSMGNRSTFAAPGIQWISAGSGIEHAEGGGCPAGMVQEGFQIWTDVPRAKKMDDPDYGTHDGTELPVVSVGEGASARVLAGTFFGATGPFRAQATLLIADVTLAAGAKASWEVPPTHDAFLAYAFKGAGDICGATLARGQIARLDAALSGNGEGRAASFVGGPEGLRVLVFSGKGLGQPVAWHGPFVMTTDSEIRTTIRDYQTGNFLKKRAPWNYKSAAAGKEWAEQQAAKDL